MRLSTDDDVYRARLVYLGPPGYALPVHLPYAQYGLFAVLVVVFVGVRYLLTWSVDLIPGWEIGAAMFTTSVVFRYVDPDRPVRTLLRVAATDWRRLPDIDRDRPLPRLVARRVLVGDLPR
jgi:hypothetical protein